MLNHFCPFLLAPQSGAHIIAPHRDPIPDPDPSTYSSGAFLPQYMVNRKSFNNCDSVIQYFGNKNYETQTQTKSGWVWVWDGISV